MELAEIEGLSASELKSRRAEIIEAIQVVDPAQLAARYVQARTDAKLFDENQAEQAKTLKNLNELLDASKQKIAEQELALQASADRVTDLTLAADDLNIQLANEREAAANELKSQMVAANQRLNEVTNSLNGQIASLTESLATQTSRAERLKAGAIRNRLALNSASKTLNDASGQQVVEDADQPA